MKLREWMHTQQDRMELYEKVAHEWGVHDSLNESLESPGADWNRQGFKAAKAAGLRYGFTAQQVHTILAIMSSMDEIADLWNLLHPEAMLELD